MRADCLLIALLIAGSLLVGCSGRNDQSVLLLERENRHLENLIWQWKDAYDEQTAKLDACQRAARAAQRAAGRDTGMNPNSSTLRAKKITAAPMETPHVEAPAGDSHEPGVLDIPEVTAPPGHSSRASRAKSVLVPVSAADEEAVDAGEVDTYVTHIVLNEKLTGGFDFDKQQYGDEGIMAVIEPRNAEGKYVPLEGDVTVSLVDPSLSGPESELVAWDFDANETVPYLKKSLIGRGFHLELRWPVDPPTKEKLRVVARYTTADGRKLETHREIFVRLASSPSGRWTPGGKANDMSAAPPKPSKGTEVESASFSRRSGPLPTPPAKTAMKLDDIELLPANSNAGENNGDFSTESAKPAKPGDFTRPSKPASPMLEGPAEPMPFPPPAVGDNWKPIR